MAVLEGEPEAVRRRVEELIRAEAPEARCELWDYEHKLKCGDLDRWGEIQEVRFMRRGITEEEVRHLAKVLATKLRTGGSTAG